MTDPIHGPDGLPLVDNFNRADGDPGANWIDNPWKPTILNQKIDCTGVDRTMVWRDPTSSPLTWAWATPSGSGDISLMARLASSDTSSDCYIVMREGTSFELSLRKSFGGLQTTLAADNINHSATTPFGLTCAGNRLQAWYWDGDNWKKGCSATDEALPGAGYVGIRIIDACIDNFGVADQGLYPGSPEEEKERYLWYRAHGLHDPVVPQENWTSWTG